MKDCSVLQFAFLTAVVIGGVVFGASSPAAARAASPKQKMDAWQSQFDSARQACDADESADCVSQLSRLANLGYTPAQLFLGGIYIVGKDVPQDYAMAAHWLRKAAEQGDVTSQYWIGYAYSKGQGVPQDYAMAASWFRKAAEQGDNTSKFMIGLYYALGQGVPQDYVQAHKWINLAAAAADDEMRNKIAQERSYIERLMTPEQIAEAQRLANEWKPIQSKAPRP